MESDLDRKAILLGNPAFVPISESRHAKCNRRASRHIGWNPNQITFFRRVGILGHEAKCRPECYSIQPTALFHSPEISICRIEILNCTFYPKPLYQRYIQVVVRAILNQSLVVRLWSLAEPYRPSREGLSLVVSLSCSWEA